MNTLEQRAFEIIVRAGHAVSPDDLARDLGVSLHAARGACYRLHQRHRAIVNTVAKGQPARWIVAPGSSAEFGVVAEVESGWPAPCALAECWKERRGRAA